METAKLELKTFYTVDCEKANIVGVLNFDSPEEFQHQGVEVRIKGQLSFAVSYQNKSFLSFFNNTKPILLVDKTVKVLPDGVIPQGKVEIPFLVPVEPEHMQLYDTYHGQSITIKYTLQCTISSSYLQQIWNILKEVVVKTKAPNRNRKGFIMK